MSTIIYFGRKRIEIDWLNVATAAAIFTFAGYFGWFIFPVLQHNFYEWYSSLSNNGQVQGH